MENYIIFYLFSQNLIDFLLFSENYASFYQHLYLITISAYSCSCVQCPKKIGIDVTAFDLPILLTSQQRERIGKGERKEMGYKIFPDVTRIGRPKAVTFIPILLGHNRHTATIFLLQLPVPTLPSCSTKICCYQLFYISKLK